MKNSSESKTKESFEESDLNNSLSIDGDSKEIESYTQICNTASSSIRWLIFAIAVCSGVITLAFAGFYFGNAEYAIKRDEAFKKECQEFWKYADECFKKENQKDRKICFEAKTDEYLQQQKCENCDNLKTLCEECSKKNADEINANILRLKKFIDETRIISLPLVNIKMLITDFVIAVIALGTFFWYWLWQILRFTRNLLCSLYNNSRSYFTQSTNHTISAQFLLIWTGGTRRSLSNLPWYVFWSFIVITLIVMTSDIFDVYQRYNIPGWSEFKVFITGKLIVEGIFLGISIYLFRMTWLLIRDIRNLLILMEWSQSSLYPLLYEIFKELKDELVEKANEISYDENEEGLFGLRFRFRFKNRKNSKDSVVFSAPVDLSKKAHKFSKRKHEERKALSWMFTKEEEENKRPTTFEERRMRRFFYEMLVEEKFGGELAKTFNSEVIKERDLKNSIKQLQDKNERNDSVDILASRMDEFSAEELALASAGILQLPENQNLSESFWKEKRPDLKSDVAIKAVVDERDED
jgi:hypothetical protein